MSAPAGREAVEQTPLQAYAPEIAVNAAGRLWRLTRAADLEQLWDAMTDDPRNFEDERLPYWTELWPSSVALAGWLAERRAAPAWIWAAAWASPPWWANGWALGSRLWIMRKTPCASRA